MIDIAKYGMSRGEFDSVRRAVGLENMIDEKAKDAEILKYLARDEDKIQRMLEDQSLTRTPVVRNGRQATVGYCPEVWKDWE